MFTPPNFDEDFAGRFDFEDEPAPALRLVEPATRCIEHGQFSCAECDGEWNGLELVMPETERMAA